MSQHAYHSGQAGSFPNPLAWWGAVSVLVGAVAVCGGAASLLAGCGGAASLLDMPTVVDALFRGRVSPSGFHCSIICQAFACLSLFVAGLGRFVRGIGGLGRMVVHPRVPVPLSDCATELPLLLERKEIPAFAVPESEKWTLLYTFFPGRLPLLTLHQRGLLAGALGTLGMGMFAALMALVASAARILADVRALDSQSLAFPWFPALIGIAALVGSALLFVAVLLSLPAAPPQTDSRAVGGGVCVGGDPRLLPAAMRSGLEALRDGGPPSSVHELGFELKAGGVADSGTVDGLLIVETHPAHVRHSGTRTADWALYSLAVAFAVVACGVVATGQGWTFSVPADSLAQMDTLEAAGVIMLRTCVVLVSAWILWMISSSSLAISRGSAGVFTWLSSGIVLRLRGTYARSHVRVGRGRMDAVESESLAVRSEVVLQATVATIVSESDGIDGPRWVVDSVVDDRARRTRDIAARVLQEFSSRGAGVLGIDVGRGGGASQVVAANIAHQRMLGDSSRASSPPARIAGAHPPVPMSKAEAEEKVCPDCAEIVKSAARKCRFCGYEFH